MLPLGIDVFTPSQMRAYVDAHATRLTELQVSDDQIQRIIQAVTRDLESFVLTSGSLLRAPNEIRRILENKPDYNEIGHVCPRTERVALTVAEAFDRDDRADRVFYTYNAVAYAEGRDPWRTIDNINGDRCGATPPIYELVFVFGLPIQVNSGYPIYMQRTRSERKAGALA